MARDLFVSSSSRLLKNDVCLFSNGDRDLVPCLIALLNTRLQKLGLMFTSPPRFIPRHICRVWIFLDLKHVVGHVLKKNVVFTLIYAQDDPKSGS